MSNLIVNKINDYLLEKVSRSKVQHLFAVSKKHLFSKVHELNEKVEELKSGNEYLNKTVSQLKKENSTLKTQSEGHRDINYKLAYESLKAQTERLSDENKGIKETLEIASNVMANTKKQNEYLKECLKRTEFINKTQEENIGRLYAENKDLKDKEKIIDYRRPFDEKFDANKFLKEIDEEKYTNQNKTVKHNFTAKRNTNTSSKNITITRQVNN